MNRRQAPSTIKKVFSFKICLLPSVQFLDSIPTKLFWKTILALAVISTDFVVYVSQAFASPK